MRHRLVLIFTVFFITSVITLAGCSKTEPVTDNSNAAITMDWYVNYSWFVTGWGENLVSKEITEKTGVEVNFITPMGNETNKLNTLIDSDTLPDIVTIGWWEPQIQEMIDKGLVYSLNELADLYDPSFYDVTREEVRNWYTLSNGNIYGYPNSSYVPEDVENNDNIAPNPTFLVRKDIYEAIGSPDMSTPDNFYNAVVKAKEMFPEVNGKPLLPIGAHEFNSDGCESFGQYLQDFLAVPYEKNGEKYDRYSDPEYINWLKMFRRLASEGYLSNDVFVDQRTQISEKIEEGRYFCMIYQRTDMADQQKILYEKDPDKIYIAVDGPRNSNGDDPVLPVNGIAGWTLTFISKNCKNPERAIKFIDFLMSEEGQKLTFLGIEGKTYDMVEDKPVIKPEVKEILSTDRKTYNDLYGADNTYWMLQNNVMQLKWQTEIDEPLKQMFEWACPYATYVGQYEVYINEDSKLGRIYASTRNLWGKTLPMLLLSESDEKFDSIFEDYLEKRAALGYDELSKEETRQIRQNKEKLGLE
ncbi:extracellular solute-binding protein [Butyrivibrio sp. JL13D10]|uniref:extracellular solute-binding protein n=1 Tax=Butyrivibrio sp. JL13D10 TaxID=3236815 RepID=UPI0038B600EA